MPVPILDLSRQHAPLAAELQAAYQRVFQSGRYILGPEVEAFEREVAALCGLPHAVGMSSGTDALLVALMALGIGPGDEVLCPAFTFFGTAGCIVRLGATPVWVDVDPATGNIDVADAARKAGPRTRAVIPVHLYGRACPMEELLAFAAAHQLRVVEDAAQAIGARRGATSVCAFGDCGILSFYPTKNLGGFGDGGMLLTRDPELATRAVWLRNHGMHPRYHHKYVGGNFRLDELQAALLRVKLPQLDAWSAARARHAAFYTAELAGHGGIQTPDDDPAGRHVWNQYTLRVGDGRRDALRAFLGARGIGTEIYYPLSLDQQECFRGVGRGGDHLPVAHELAASVLSLPVFPELTAAELREVVAALWAFGYHGAAGT
jgi:dTDP-4-amino-4,6-dideoxygalactose transaminase